jgi:putative ABC transport system permease protein
MHSSLRESLSRPGVTAVAVVTLALGVAGATTMFAMLGAVGGAMVPPGVEAERVGRIVWTGLDESGGRSPLTAREFVALSGGAPAFEVLSASLEQPEVLGDDGPSVSVKRISPEFLRTFGFTVGQGREFRRDEYQAGTPPVAIVGESFVRRFPAHALGKPVRLGGIDYTVVGLMPDRCWFPVAGATDVWLPLPLSRDGQPLSEPVVVTGRLRSPAHLGQAQQQVALVTERLAAGSAAGSRRKLTFFTLQQDVGKRMGFGLVGLLGPSIVVLLIACGNVANLLLARAARREREMAVRAALGAARWRLVRERLAEGFWPAAAGGAAGTGLAFALVAALRAWVGSVPESRTAAAAIRMDARALLFALAVTMAIPFLFGLVPALVASRPNLLSALHQSPGRRKPRRGPYGGRDLLVIVEVGLAVVLVVCAGMFARFFAELANVKWGFDPTRVVAVQLEVKREPGTEEAASPLVDRVLTAVRALPGVERAATGAFVGIGRRGDPAEFEGCAASGLPQAASVEVDDEYLSTLGLRTLRGRGLERRDLTTGAPVAVISSQHAERCWPGQDPLGKRLKLSAQHSWGPASGPSVGATEWFTIVGVVPDAVTTRAIDAPQPVYVPLPRGRVASTVFLRTRGEAATLERAVRTAIRQVDKSQPLGDIGRLDTRFLEELSGSTMIVGIIGAFGIFALALAALGVFSVISYMVAERTREFGVRIALGASTAEVLRLVVRQAAVIIGLGAAVSIVGTLAVTRTAFREMADLAVTDPLLWLGVTALLALVAVAATIVPARRATSVQPSVALRAE